MSQDFKNALDAEIGLDEPARRPAPRSPSALDAQLTEEMRRSAEAEAWGGSPPGAAGSALPSQGKEEIPSEAAAESPAPPSGKLPDLSRLDD